MVARERPWELDERPPQSAACVLCTTRYNTAMTREWTTCGHRCADQIQWCRRAVCQGGMHCLVATPRVRYLSFTSVSYSAGLRARQSTDPYDMGNLLTSTQIVLCRFARGALAGLESDQVRLHVGSSFGSFGEGMLCILRGCFQQGVVSSAHCRRSPGCAKLSIE